MTSNFRVEWDKPHKRIHPPSSTTQYRHRGSLITVQNWAFATWRRKLRRSRANFNFQTLSHSVWKSIEMSHCNFYVKKCLKISNYKREQRVKGLKSLKAWKARKVQKARKPRKAKRTWIVPKRIKLFQKELDYSKRNKIIPKGIKLFQKE